jgi:WD40 repeat protein
MIYEARCEISSSYINLPIQMAMSPGGACISWLSMGGYKNRDPFLSYFIPGDDDNDFPDGQRLLIGLSDIAYDSAIDESRSLIFAVDSWRIKSYKWDATDNKGNTLATHTMDSGPFEGPLAMLSNGRLLRAGKGSAGVWNIDDLKTHGSNGRKRIGKKFDTEDTWREDPEEIETSRGSTVHQQIKFADDTIRPARWHAHPSANGTMLCASDPRAKPHRFWCGALDLEHGGKTSALFLGHGGQVTSFSTSEADQAVFTTACLDGCVRLYDVRHPLPTLTMDVGKKSSSCDTALLVHPDGIPSETNSS